MRTRACKHFFGRLCYIRSVTCTCLTATGFAKKSHIKQPRSTLTDGEQCEMPQCDGVTCSGLATVCLMPFSVNTSSMRNGLMAYYKLLLFCACGPPPCRLYTALSCLFLKWFHFFCLKTSECISPRNICFSAAGPLDGGYCVHEHHTCRGKRHTEVLLYTPSSARTVLGTAGTSGRSGAGHFRQHCEPSPALRRQHKSTTTHAQTHRHVSECTGICELLYECLFRGLLSIKLRLTHHNLFKSQVQPKAKLFLT